LTKCSFYFGHPGLSQAIKDSSKDAFDSAVQAVVWKRYSFRLKLKHETYQGQDRPKLSVRRPPAGTAPPLGLASAGTATSF